MPFGGVVWRLVQTPLLSALWPRQLSSQRLANQDQQQYLCIIHYYLLFTINTLTDAPLVCANSRSKPYIYIYICIHTYIHIYTYTKSFASKSLGKITINNTYLLIIYWLTYYLLSISTSLCVGGKVRPSKLRSRLMRVCMLCVYIYIYICICIDIHVHVCIYIYIYIHAYIHTYNIHTYMHAYIHTYIHTYTHVLCVYIYIYIHSVYVCMYVCMHACMYVCMHVGR